MSNDPLLTKKEVASTLRVIEKTVDDYRKKGKLTGLKVGRKVLFYQSQVLKALQPERREAN